MHGIYKIILGLVLLVPLVASAHGLVTTLSQTTGDYKIEFEYNTLGDVFTGDYTIYDTYLLSASDSQPQDFDSAFIRIQKKDGPAIMAGSLAESGDRKGYASMSSIIQDPGSYRAQINFYKGDGQLAQAQFDFNVISPSTKSTARKSNLNNLLLPTVVFLVGLALGAGGRLWIKSRKKI